MRFSVLTSFLAASGAIAAPISGLPSTSSATSLLKGLNTELEGSASNIRSALSNLDDKDAVTKKVNAELQNMKSSVQSLGSKFTNDGSEPVARREESVSAIKLQVNADGKPVLAVPLKSNDKRAGDFLSVDVNGKPVLSLPQIKRDGNEYHLEVEIDGKPVIVAASGKRDGEILTVDVNGKPVLSLPPTKREQGAAIEIDLDDKPVIQLPPQNAKRDSDSDNYELASEMKTAVDTVQNTVDTANQKLGGDAVKADAVSLFASLNSLSSGVVSLLTL